VRCPSPFHFEIAAADSGDVNGVIISGEDEESASPRNAGWHARHRWAVYILKLYMGHLTSSWAIDLEERNGLTSPCARENQRRVRHRLALQINGDVAARGASKIS
jgi:hypothetical protein